MKLKKKKKTSAGVFMPVTQRAWYIILHTSLNKIQLTTTSLHYVVVLLYQSKT
jgi:hypothetical protein